MSEDASDAQKERLCLDYEGLASVNKKRMWDIMASKMMDFYTDLTKNEVRKKLVHHYHHVFKQVLYKGNVEDHRAQITKDTWGFIGCQVLSHRDINSEEKKKFTNDVCKKYMYDNSGR